MFYTIYRTTNLIDNKIYIGKHQTENLEDNYLGSGKYLLRAIKKYGRKTFIREILFVFDNEQDMNSKEKELVTEEFCSREDTYNICPGGTGGWGYVNNNGLRGLCNPEKISQTLKGRKNPHVSERLRLWHKQGKVRYNTRTGQHHSEEAKRKIGLANSKFIGEKNSSFGSIWITDGINNRKIKSSEIIPKGWSKGRNIFQDQKLRTIKIKKIEKFRKYLKDTIRDRKYSLYFEEYLLSGLSIRKFSTTKDIPFQTLSAAWIRLGLKK